MNLTSLLINELRLSEYQKRALKKPDIKTVKDLLWHFPARYEETGEKTTIADLTVGEKAILSGRISGLKFEKTWKKKMNIARAVLNDGTGKINLVWFHQPYMAKILKENEEITVSGKIQTGKNGLPAGRQDLYVSNPTNLSKSNFNRLTAVYPETRGLSSRWFRFNIQKILNKLPAENFIDIVPQKILNKYHLPSLKNSLIYIHAPKQKKDAEAAAKRFAFEEIFTIQLSRMQKRIWRQKENAFSIKAEEKEINKFLKNLSFKLTKAQQKSIEHIAKDLQKNSPMSRLLEGDVGSGKTAVAALASFLVFKNGYQTAYMAPTEVLAKQLFDSFINYFSNTGAKLALLTSSESKKFPSKLKPAEATHVSKNRLLKWLEDGEIDIVIGTHSLIQDRVKFSRIGKSVYQNKKLAMVIIDEQHRFGTNQRATLTNKKNESDKRITPHLLSMTATPIPRTLALTIYADLDLTLLDEMPPDRKEIITEIIPPNQREKAYQKIKEEIEKGKQAYIICPRIEPSDIKKENLLTLNTRAVKEEYERLSKEVFPEYKLGMLHGKMTPKEKEETMKNFSASDGENRIDILIATSMIEVGVNVPNATVIVIEGAERFGLAQLHQLRGRVLRSTHQPYCFIFTESKSQKTLERLATLRRVKNGFELAEHDLKLRGPGELSGKKQWGISDIGMEALKNIKMVEAARLEAKNILSSDPELNNYPLLKEKLGQENLNIHFE